MLDGSAEVFKVGLSELNSRAAVRVSGKKLEGEDMIPLSNVQIISNGQPTDVFSFTPTSKITELEFRSGSLHLRHTKEAVWPFVMLDTAQQQATFWVLAQINGQWFAAGMERLRPNQQDKPEGDNPRGFIAGFVEGRNFGPFNGHTFQQGERIGFMVVQGDTRLGNNAPLRERSLVVEMAFPPSGQILWEEGQVAQPEQPQQPQQPQQPSQGGSPSPQMSDQQVKQLLQTIDDLRKRVDQLSRDALKSGDRVALRTDNGHVVCAEGGGGGAVHSDRENVGTWETFKLEKQ